MKSDDPQSIFVPPHSGKKLEFRGVTHKLTSDQTGGAYYLFESVFEPETGNRLHVHRRACVASSTIVAAHRTRPAAHSAYWAAIGNPRAAEYAVNKKITYESEATRVAQAKVSIQFESVAEGTQITSQRALAMADHRFSG